MNELTKSIEDFIGPFESLGLEYAIMGGIAVRVYGIPRATFDVDFTTAIARENLPELFRRVQALGYTVPEPYWSGWLDQVGGMPLAKFSLYIAERIIDIDIFLAESHFQRTVLARRKRTKLNGVNAWLVSPEDLILFELLASRPRDIADVGDVLFMQGQLDIAHLRQWATELGVSQRLESAISEQFSP
jgi:hypothetical protein